MSGAPIFISYRRTTDDMAAGRLHDRITREFGQDAVFRDTTMRIGESWPDQVREALSECSTVIAVIGPRWLEVADDKGRQRIFQEDDWVRLELTTALEDGKRVIPTLVGDFPLFPPEALPEPVRRLLDQQDYGIRERYFDHDCELLLKALATDVPDRPGGQRSYSLYPVPAPPEERPEPISDDRLAEVLAGTLSAWERVESSMPGDAGATRVEIHREFHFGSFAAAIEFMAQVAPGCDIAIHHPRWQNVWKTVEVWLSTWDLGAHRVTDRDLQLAKYFDTAHRDFPGAAP